MVSVALIDLSGTLHIANYAIPGAQEALRKLRAAGVKVLFVSNTTKESRARLHERLTKLGYDIAVDEIFTSLNATRRYVEDRSLSPFLFLPDAALDDFSGLDATRPAEAKSSGGDSSSSPSSQSSSPNAVVVGLAPEHFHYPKLNEAYRLLLGGAELIAIHKEPYYATPSGMSLGPGAFVSALEYAANIEAAVIGKPTPAFFQSALDYLKYNGPKDEVVMIGDSIRGDALGAVNAGLLGVLVKTGKYREGDETRFAGRPTATVSDFPAAVEWVLERRNR